MDARVTLAPDLPDLAALGASGIADFLAEGAGLVTAARCKRLQAERGRTLLRVPLPGTPDASGVRLESPRGAGTGWLRAHVFESGPLAHLRTRLVKPPSSSPAARRWNLLCHLRAQGVGAPRPLALLEAPRGLGQLSVCVEAELEGHTPLPAWLGAMGGAARARGLRAVALGLAALGRSGVQLGRARAEGILLGDPEAGDDDCAALSLTRLREEHADWRRRGVVRARLPAVAFVDLDRARLAPRAQAGTQLEFMDALWADLQAAGARLTPREALRLALTACGPRPEKSALAQVCSARATAWDRVTS